MNDRKPISSPKLNWIDEDGRSAPVSTQFDDVYFSGNGAAETAHVFLGGNNLPARWREAKHFCIGELGFGTGLNFLAAADAFQRAEKPNGAVLHFLSFEAFPLSCLEMERAHCAWPQFAALAESLRANLPPQAQGFHQRWITDDICLTLYYGDAIDGLTKAEAEIDAWFFDGFSPAKNPAMWTPEIFAACGACSAPGATFATFTVAGSVRRAIKDAGFNWEKRPGFGRKREMLAGWFDAPPPSEHRAPWYPRGAALGAGSHIAIIGAGIAGASLAEALRRTGVRTTVFEQSAPAAGASGNSAGLIMPRLDADDTPAARFFVSAYLHALSAYARFGGEIFNPCGVLLHETDTKSSARFDRLIAMGALPEADIERRTTGLFFPRGGVVDPAALVRALLGRTEIRIETVTKIGRDGDCWHLDTDKSAERFDGVVIANANGALKFGQSRTLPLAGSAGQVDWFEHAPSPDIVHAFGPYAAPCLRGGLVIGATYAPVSIGAKPTFSADATQSNIRAISAHLPEFAELETNASAPRMSVRCTTPDRLPIAGPVPDWGFYAGAYDGLRTGRRTTYPTGELLPGLFILTGLGSRGLVTAPLCSAMIAAEIAGAPAPAEAEVGEILHPARFFIRDLKRGRPERD